MRRCACRRAQDGCDLFRLLPLWLGRKGGRFTAGRGLMNSGGLLVGPVRLAPRLIGRGGRLWLLPGVRGWELLRPRLLACVLLERV